MAKKEKNVVLLFGEFVDLFVFKFGFKEDARRTDIFTDMSDVIQYTMKRVTQT